MASHDVKVSNLGWSDTNHGETKSFVSHQRGPLFTRATRTSPVSCALRIAQISVTFCQTFQGALTSSNLQLDAKQKETILRTFVLRDEYTRVVTQLRQPVEEVDGTRNWITRYWSKLSKPRMDSRISIEPPSLQWKSLISSITFTSRMFISQKPWLTQIREILNVTPGKFSSLKWHPAR